MKQLINSICIFLLLSMAGFAQAEKPISTGLEVYPLQIKLSNDRTGIIKNVTCGGCEYKIGKITRNTQVYVNGENVDLLRARDGAGKPAYIKFVRKTGEIVAIYFNE